MTNVRMVDHSGSTTEVNDTRFGLIVPDAEGAVSVPEECIPEMERAGFKLAPLSQSRRLARIADAIRELDESPIRTAMLDVIREHQMKAWNALQSATAPA
jgi:hypothetical protein